MYKRFFIFISYSAFCFWMALFSIYGLHRTGIDDKTIMLANSECLAHPERHHEMVERRDIILKFCRDDDRCHWRSSERLMSVYNYPINSLTMHAIRGFLGFRSDCENMSRAISSGYLASTALILGLFFFCIHRLRDSSSKIVIQYALIPMVLFHPYVSPILPALSVIGFPYTDALTYPLAPYPRSNLPLLYIASLFLIKELRLSLIMVVMTTQIALHVGQGALANIPLIALWFLQTWNGKKAVQFYIPPVVMSGLTIAGFLFAQSNYTATPFSFSALRVLSAFSDLPSLMLLLIAILIFIWFRREIFRDGDRLFLSQAILVLLLSAVAVRAYNISLLTEGEPITTLRIIANRFESVIVVAFYLAVADLVRRCLVDGQSRILRNGISGLFALVSLLLIPALVRFSARALEEIPRAKEVLLRQVCDAVPQLPERTIIEEIENGSLDPFDEPRFHLTIERTCREP